MINEDGYHRVVNDRGNLRKCCENSARKIYFGRTVTNFPLVTVNHSNGSGFSSNFPSSFFCHLYFFLKIQENLPPFFTFEVNFKSAKLCL